EQRLMLPRTSGDGSFRSRCRKLPAPECRFAPGHRRRPAGLALRPGSTSPDAGPRKAGMPRHPPIDHSALHLPDRVWQCAGELFQAEMAGIDITPRQYSVLAAAASKDGLSQQEIIDMTGIDRSTVSQVVQTMMRKNLLKRQRTRADARTYSITVT